MENVSGLSHTRGNGHVLSDIIIDSYCVHTNNRQRVVETIANKSVLVQQTTVNTGMYIFIYYVYSFIGVFNKKIPIIV